MTRIVLASGSPTRARMLESAGLAFEIVVPQVDEQLVKTSMIAERAKPAEIALALAEMKAARVSAKHPDAVVIGADQILHLDGDIVSKSQDVAEARRLLRRLSGRTHELITAVTLARGGSMLWQHTERARLTMRRLGDDELDAYLARNADDILGSVGCYRLEGEGVRLFSDIDGDYFGILGLPLLALLNALRELDAAEP